MSYLLEAIPFLLIGLLLGYILWVVMEEVERVVRGRG